MRVLVTGDRNYEDYAMIHVEMRKLREQADHITIIHGGARGADQMAAAIAIVLGYKIKSYPAQWNTYGKRAGPIRNQLMLDQRPDLVLAFHKNLGESKGTKDMVMRALRAGIPVILEGKPYARRPVFSD